MNIIFVYYLDERFIKNCSSWARLAVLPGKSKKAAPSFSFWVKNFLSTLLLSICTWFLKSLVHEIDFLSISNWIFTACVACKTSVRKLEISKIKCRSTRVMRLILWAHSIKLIKQGVMVIRGWCPKLVQKVWVTSLLFCKMILLWGDHFSIRTAWSLIYFLNYSLLWYLNSPVANFGHHPLCNYLLTARSA